MQHPDEGTIHSWLDGALPAEEAASVESHVATCHSCAAVVAEARGFIAASSRILTALDDVPRGVVPAVPLRKRDLRVFWRAAAAMLVVAGGSLVVMREGGPDASVATTSKSPVPITVLPAPAVSAEASAGAGSSVVQPDRVALKEKSTISSMPPESKAAISDERDLSARAERRRADALEGGVIGGRTAVDAATPTSATAQVAANAAPSDGGAALKVLRVEQIAGSRRTTYEIAPSEIVTLTEPMPVLGAVVTAQGTASPQIMLRGNNRDASPSRLEATTASPPPPAVMDSRTGTDSVLTSRESAVAKTAAARPQTGASFTAAVNTIRWTEARTGRTLTLTGSLPVERLQEIRLRIERERAAPKDR